MKKKLLIRDLTLRDGQQSKFATRMNQEQVDKVLSLFHKANFYAMEVWGGAVPDSVMRFLAENPWDRLRSIKAGVGETSKLTALSRGRNLFGYNPYPDSVIEGFNRKSIENGIDIMRIFDALNDLSNMEYTIKVVKENKGMTDCAICYTVDPKFTKKQRRKAFFSGKKLPKAVFTPDYYYDKAVELEKMGADIITIKDMAGLIPPSLSGELVRGLKERVSIPIDFHTHSTPGYGLAAVLMAIVNGIDIVDTNIMNFAGGTAAPAYEIIHVFAKKLGLDTGVDVDVVYEINKKLKDIRIELAEYDSGKMFPIEFHPEKDTLPAEIDALFDKAIVLAKEDKEEELLECTHQIEKYFNFPKPNELVKNAEIPGGMYSNMLSQLKTLQLDHLLETVLETIPIVRIDSGCPPLVTPTSQIVGAQTVNYVIDINKGDPVYTNTSTQFVNLVKGSYGKTPLPVDPDFRKKIVGSPEEIPYNTDNYKTQDNPVLEEFGGLKLAKNEEEELLLELFPSVAIGFLKKQKQKEYEEIQKAEAAEEERKLEEEKKKFLEEKDDYDKLSEEEKQERLLRGLYHYNWSSVYEE